jgi:uroporphyrinogen decarboxylase
MPQTSREIVKRCITLKNPERMPRDLWTLPWAVNRFPEMLKEISRRYPNDIIEAPKPYRESSRVTGDQYGTGLYTDEWGCIFENVQDGVIGEVKHPIIADLSDLSAFQPPFEILPIDKNKARDEVNRFCHQTELFVTAGCCPRPWERMQFLRGSANAMMDTAMPELGGADLLRKIHEFYMNELEFWVSTDVDGIFFMDDWGSQRNLLISPDTWRVLFKPLYKDYCDIAHSHGKYVFMHSDGWIQSIFPDLIEIRVDAVNSQLFVMDMAELAQIAIGKITFWGEIDRQQVLTSTNELEVREAVRKVAKHFYDPSGGIIIQFEMGAGFHGPNALTIYDEWDKIQSGI